MSQLTDRWGTRQVWDQPLRSPLLLWIGLAFWILMVIASILVFRDAWRGGMIGSRWIWITVSVLFAARSLYRVSRLIRALRIGAYRGGVFDR